MIAEESTANDKITSTPHARSDLPMQTIFYQEDEVISYPNDLVINFFVPPSKETKDGISTNLKKSREFTDQSRMKTLSAEVQVITELLSSKRQALISMKDHLEECRTNLLQCIMDAKDQIDEYFSALKCTLSKRKQSMYNKLAKLESVCDIEDSLCEIGPLLDSIGKLEEAGKQQSKEIKPSELRNLKIRANNLERKIATFTEKKSYTDLLAAYDIEIVVSSELQECLKNTGEVLVYPHGTGVPNRARILYQQRDASSSSSKDSSLIQPSVESEVIKEQEDRVPLEANVSNSELGITFSTSDYCHTLSEAFENATLSQDSNSLPRVFSVESLAGRGNIFESLGIKDGDLNLSALEINNNRLKDCEHGTKPALEKLRTNQINPTICKFKTHQRSESPHRTTANRTEMKHLGRKYQKNNKNVRRLSGYNRAKYKYLEYKKESIISPCTGRACFAYTKLKQRSTCKLLCLPARAEERVFSSSPISSLARFSTENQGNIRHETTSSPSSLFTLLRENTYECKSIDEDSYEDTEECVDAQKSTSRVGTPRYPRMLKRITMDENTSRKLISTRSSSLHVTRSSSSPNKVVGMVEGTKRRHSIAYLFKEASERAEKFELSIKDYRRRLRSVQLPEYATGNRTQDDRACAPPLAQSNPLNKNRTTTSMNDVQVLPKDPLTHSLSAPAETSENRKALLRSSKDDNLFQLSTSLPLSDVTSPVKNVDDHCITPLKKKPRRHTITLKMQECLSSNLNNTEKSLKRSRRFENGTISHTMKMCNEWLKDIWAMEESWIFVRYVDAKLVPDYYDIIEDPICLLEISNRVDALHYQSLDEFVSDVELLFKNCSIYNLPTSTPYKYGQILEKRMAYLIKNSFPRCKFRYHLY